MGKVEKYPIKQVALLAFRTQSFEYMLKGASGRSIASPSSEPGAPHVNTRDKFVTYPQKKAPTLH